MSRFKVYKDLKFSSSDYSVLLFALSEELRFDQRFLETFPDNESVLSRVDAFKRLIHILGDSGEWFNESD